MASVSGMDDSFKSAQEDADHDVTDSVGDLSDEDEEWDDITGYDTQNSRYTTVADRNCWQNRAKWQECHNAHRVRQRGH